MICRRRWCAGPEKYQYYCNSFHLPISECFLNSVQTFPAHVECSVQLCKWDLLRVFVCVYSHFYARVCGVLCCCLISIISLYLFPLFSVSYGTHFYFTEGKKREKARDDAKIKYGWRRSFGCHIGPQAGSNTENEFWDSSMFFSFFALLSKVK